MSAVHDFNNRLTIWKELGLQGPCLDAVQAPHGTSVGLHCSSEVMKLEPVSLLAEVCRLVVGVHWASFVVDWPVVSLTVTKVAAKVTGWQIAVVDFVSMVCIGTRVYYNLQHPFIFDRVIVLCCTHR